MCTCIVSQVCQQKFNSEWIRPAGKGKTVTKSNICGANFEAAMPQRRSIHCAA